MIWEKYLMHRKKRFNTCIIGGPKDKNPSNASEQVLKSIIPEKLTEIYIY